MYNQPFVASRARTHARTHKQKFEPLIINAKSYCTHKLIDETLNITKISVISDI